MSGIAFIACVMFMFIRVPYVPFGMTHKDFGLAQEEDYFTQGGTSHIQKESSMV
jgi:hypothetical protein